MTTKDKLIKELTQKLKNVQEQAYELEMGYIDLQENHGGNWGEAVPDEERTIFTGMGTCPNCGCVTASTQDSDKHRNPCMRC